MSLHRDAKREGLSDIGRPPLRPIRPSSDVYYGLPKDLLDRGLAASDGRSEEISDTVRDIMQSEQTVDVEQSMQTTRTNSGGEL